MSQQNKGIMVRILDKEYRIACPEEEEMVLRNAAHYLDGQMRQIEQGGRVVGLERIAVMAALNITHELMVSRQSQPPTVDVEALDARIQSLYDKIEAALGPAQESMAPTESSEAPVS